MTCKPCIYCPHSPECEIRQSKVAAVRGLGITTMTFKCATFTDTFKPGMEVRVTLPLKIDEGYIDEGPTYEVGEVIGTFMRWKGTKLLVAVHEDQEPTTDKPLIKVWPKRATPTGAYSRICIHCSKPEHVELKGALGEGWTCRYASDDESTSLPCEYVIPPQEVER